MDDDTLLKVAACSTLTTSNHMTTALESLASVHRSMRTVVFQRRLPDEGLPEAVVSLVLAQMAALDSNNFPGHTGAGEREGRVFSSIVRQRHFAMSHGIGRSGELDAHQPKAAGASLLYALTNALALSACRAAGLLAKRTFEEALVFPLSTGMTISAVLRCLANQRGPQARYVIWCRIDQKTCLKCIPAAGLTPVMVDQRRAPQYHSRSREKNAEDTVLASAGETTATPPPVSLFVQSAIDDIRAAIMGCEGGPSAVAAVLSTTSCFAPRLPDDVLAIARLCKELAVPHIVNNAYGLQSQYIAKRLVAAAENGRVDAVIQSTDKNFMVPVGGAVVLGPSPVVRAVSSLYPGRASAAPIVDLFATLLQMGSHTYVTLAHTARYALLNVFHARMRDFAAARSEAIVVDARNDISFGMTLGGVWRVSGRRNTATNDGAHQQDRCVAEPADTPPPYAVVYEAAVNVGARLFHLGVTGPKVVATPPQTRAAMEGTSQNHAPPTDKKVGSIPFASFGMHGTDSIGDVIVPPLLIVACAIGMEPREVGVFFEKLANVYPLPLSPLTSC